MLWSRWEAPVIPSGVLLVVRGGLRPDYTFSFESWREADCAVVVADVPRVMPQAADVQMWGFVPSPFFWPRVMRVPHHHHSPHRPHPHHNHKYSVRSISK